MQLNQNERQENDGNGQRKGMTMKTKEETLKILRKAKSVRGWVKFTEEDGSYLLIVKKQIQERIRVMSDDTMFDIDLQEDGNAYFN